MTSPSFGVPWAPNGESRPSQFRTPLAWVDGHAGGVVFVERGRKEDRFWQTMVEWDDWVRETKAAPVEPEKPDEPAEHDQLGLRKGG